MRARTAAGTDIVADLNPNYKWLKTSGIISPNKWGNLPGGEVFTTPGEVNGVFVIDGVVGDYLCAKYGDLRETPLTIQVEKNRLKEAACADSIVIASWQNGFVNVSAPVDQATVVFGGSHISPPRIGAPANIFPLLTSNS